jgi:hypothetical protein
MTGQPKDAGSTEGSTEARQHGQPDVASASSRNPVWNPRHPHAFIIGHCQHQAKSEFASIATSKRSP